MTQCPICGRETPSGGYCIHCGAHLPHGQQSHNALRTHAYAANPHEPVSHPSIVSTLFPHLSPAGTHRMRWLLLVLATLIFLIGLGRLVPLSIVLSALLVPLLYLFYFFDALVFDEEPLPVLLLTFGVGALMGIGMSLIFFRIILSQTLFSVHAQSINHILLTGVGLPLLAQALMLVGPLLLFVLRPRFDEVLDGLVFGSASGLGFAAAQSIIYSWLLLRGPFAQSGPSYSWALLTIQDAILTPLLYAATTGLICSALWLARDRTERVGRYGLLPLPAAIMIAVLGIIVPPFAVNLLGGDVLNLVWYAGTIVVLLLLLRRILHVGLIEKARELAAGGEVVCPHCAHIVPDAAFCRHCGIALRSIARRDRRVAPTAPTTPTEGTTHG